MVVVWVVIFDFKSCLDVPNGYYFLCALSVVLSCFHLKDMCDWMLALLAYLKFLAERDFTPTPTSC